MAPAKNSKQINIIYVVGYGRLGSTTLSIQIATKDDCINLGEAKYLFANGKDDLLTPEWIKFKATLSEHNKLIVKLKDSILGIFFVLFWNKTYKKVHDQLFSQFPTQSFVDSSKTTFDTIIRPYNLRRSGYQVQCVKSPLPMRYAVNSIWQKGKNSTIERHGSDISPKFSRIPSIIHCVLSELLCGIYKYEKIKLTSDSNNSVNAKKFIVYGNRSRK